MYFPTTEALFQPLPMPPPVFNTADRYATVVAEGQCLVAELESILLDHIKRLRPSWTTFVMWCVHCHEPVCIISNSLSLPWYHLVYKCHANWPVRHPLQAVQQHWQDLWPSKRSLHTYVRTSQDSGGGENAQCEGHTEWAEVHYLVSVLIQGYESGHEKAVFELEAIIPGVFCYFETITFKSCVIDSETSMVRTIIINRRRQTWWATDKWSEMADFSSHTRFNPMGSDNHKYPMNGVQSH